MSSNLVLLSTLLTAASVCSSSREVAILRRRVADLEREKEQREGEGQEQKKKVHWEDEVEVKDLAPVAKEARAAPPDEVRSEEGLLGPETREKKREETQKFEQ